MKTIISVIIMAVAGCVALAVNPLDHTSLLRKNDLDNPMPKEDVIDVEDPYFILTGEAVQAMRDSDYHTAIFRIQDAIRIEPDNPSNALLYSNMGIAYNCLNEDSLALNAYDRALEIAPSMTTVYNNRALLKLKMGLDREARSDFEVVIGRDSLNLDARFYHGLISLYGGDLESSVRDFVVLKGQSPDAYNTAVALSTLYSLTGDDAKAIPYFQRLIELDPSVEYYAALAGCYLATQNLTDAGETIAEGLKMFGDDPELYYYRAWLKRDQYLNDQAQADARKAIALGADRSKVAALFKKH